MTEQVYVRVSRNLLVVAVCVAVCVAMFSSGVVASASVFVSLAEPDSHTKSGRESGDTRILSWCCTVSMSVGN